MPPFNKAFAEVLDGDNDAAMETLDAFAPLREHPVWNSYLANIAAIRVPVGTTEVAARSDKSDFIPEGIAVDGNGDIILGSIRYGKILLDAGREEERAVGPFGHWSVFGMRYDDEGHLWFASSRVPQYTGISDRSAYMAGLYRFSLQKGEVDRRARLPVNGNDQVLGDLVIADDNTIYTTDSIDGPVYDRQHRWSCVSLLNCRQ
jgi:sugar lactone lactonase YvrE